MKVYKCDICLGKYDKKGIRVPDNTKVDDYTKKCKPCVQAFGGPYGMIKL